MRKTIIDTIDDGVCEDWEIQHKAFWPNSERDYWAMFVKLLFQKESAAKYLIKYGEIKYKKQLVAAPFVSCPIPRHLCKGVRTFRWVPEDCP